MCSDPEERQRFFDDPECNYTCTTDCSLTLLLLMKETYSRKGWHVANPSLPILFISGENDSCMISMKKFHQSAGFLNSVGYTDVSSIIFPDMRHEVLNEIGKESAWQAISEFISREHQGG
jgi:alpha-beta hydrolase superfamily lysophospholipase